MKNVAGLKSERIKLWKFVLEKGAKNNFNRSVFLGDNDDDDDDIPKHPLMNAHSGLEL